MSEIYKLGAIPSKHDDRDYSVRIPPHVELPRNFRQQIGTVYTQDAGTCVAQSLRSCMTQIYDKIFGVDFLYGGGRSHKFPGLYPAEAATFIAKYGMALMNDDPTETEVTEVIGLYNANRARLEPLAAPFAGCAWARVTTVSEIKNSLFSGMYIIACFAISQWNPKSNGVYTCVAPIEGYHEMRVYGWDDEYALAVNSWGRDWGKNGTCLVSWEDVLRCKDVIAIRPPSGAHKDPKHDTVIRRTLIKGMKGDDVAELQTKLNALGHICGEVDGDFGSKTRTAVKRFQRVNNLLVDGKVGKDTWGKIDEVMP